MNYLSEHFPNQLVDVSCVLTYIVRLEGATSIMQEYTTALLQIVSTKMSAEEIAAGLQLPNAARQQPPAPHAYFGFETKVICSSPDINAHIDVLLSKLSQTKGFLLNLQQAGDEITVLWFADAESTPYSVLSPNSMKALAEFKLPLLITNTTPS